MDWGLVAKFTGVVVAMLDPIGNLPVYLNETKSDTPHMRRRLSLLLAVSLAGAMLAVYLGGRALLGFFGVSLPAFKLAGGLLLLLYGLKRLNDTGARGAAAESVQGRLSERFRALVVPVCIPLYVGPGTISTVIAYSQLVDSALMRWAMMLALIVAAAAVGVTLVFSGAVKRVLGDTGLTVVSRLMGLILAAVGVELLLQGFAAVMPGMFGAAIRS